MISGRFLPFFGLNRPGTVQIVRAQICRHHSYTPKLRTLGRRTGELTDNYGQWSHSISTLDWRYQEVPDAIVRTIDIYDIWTGLSQIRPNSARWLFSCALGCQSRTELSTVNSTAREPFSLGERVVLWNTVAVAISRYAVDWRRSSRRSFVAALLLLIILIWPTARCSWSGIRDTSLVEYDGFEGDSSASPQGDAGFFARAIDSIGHCYADDGISVQAAWKRKLFWGLLILSIVCGLIHRTTLSKRHSGY